MGAILGLHLAARNPGKVQGVSLFSPTLWINGWAMPWYAAPLQAGPLALVRQLLELPGCGVARHQVPARSPVREVGARHRQGSDYGRAGVPGTMVLEHRRMVDAAMNAPAPREAADADRALAGKTTTPTSTTPSYLQGELAGNVDMVVLNDSYHMVTLDKQRHVVVDSTRAFVDKIVDGLRNVVPARPFRSPPNRKVSRADAFARSLNSRRRFAR